MHWLHKDHWGCLAVLICLFLIQIVHAEVFLDINFSDQTLGTQMLRTTAGTPGAIFTGDEPVGQIDETLNNDTDGKVHFMHDKKKPRCSGTQF